MLYADKIVTQSLRTAIKLKEKEDKGDDFTETEIDELNLAMNKIDMLRGNEIINGIICLRRHWK